MTVANCSDGTQRRDFLHIEDVGRAIVSLLDSDVTGPTNICSGQAIPIREIAIQAAELIGKREFLRLAALRERCQPSRWVNCDRAAQDR